MGASTKTPAKGESNLVTREMRVHDIVTLFPECVSVLQGYGIHCASCAVGGMETLEEGCAMHGFTDEVTDELIEDLNSAVKDSPERPEELHLTLIAAEQIAAIAESEGRKGDGLAVLLDDAGSFCMEFRAAPEKGDKVFSHAEKPETRLFASLPTLHHIGGSTIDFRDGRFKLDLPGAKCGCGGGECDC
jgi:hybrid cluster-associated redox disulfide protein